MKDKEAIYDEQISPLMATIIRTCQREGIAMIATFHVPSDRNSELFCTTATVDETGDQPNLIKRAARVICGNSSSPALRITERDASGKVVRDSIFLDG